MKVLVTGASGFLGRHLVRELSGEGISTLGLGATDSIRCDLSKEAPTLQRYDLVVHAAGRAHQVPRTPKEACTFFDVNRLGTQNLLSSLDRAGQPLSFVLISTVAVYGCASGRRIGELEPLRAEDPYGASKREAEALVSDWCSRRDVRCAILRLPLVAGTNPPGNLGAMIRGVSRGFYFNVAGGTAAKSMVLATDVAAIVASASKVGGVYNLTDGVHPTFAQISSLVARQLGRREPRSLPYWAAAILALVGDGLGSYAPFTSKMLRAMTSDLTFDDTKARRLLAWCPTSVLDGFRVTEH